MFIFIIALLSIGHIATDIYLPSLPGIANYFHAPISTVQITVSVYLLGIAMSPLIFGPLSDLIGRKKVVIGGLLFGMVAAICCSMATSIYFLIAGRAMQGIAMGAIVVSARAMVPDLYVGKELTKRITYISMFMQVILSVAPIIGGCLQEWLQWRAVFIFLVLPLCVLLWIMQTTSETLKKITTKQPAKQKILAVASSYKKLLNNGPFMFYSLCSIIPFVGLFAYLTASPFLFQNILGLSPSNHGMLSLYIGGCVLMYGYINTKLIQYFSLPKIILFGITMIVCAGLLLMLFTCLGITTVVSILIPILLYYSFPVITMANSTSLALAQLDGSSYGAARALGATGQFLAGALGSFIFSLLPVKDGFHLALCFIINGFVMLFCLFMAQRGVRFVGEVGVLEGV